MQRVLVIGSPGAGKSTLATALARVTALPLIHLDQQYWRPGWVEPTKQEWHSQLQQLAARERWIMDGNYGGSLEARLAPADTVVYLDFPAWLCVWRVFKRIASSLGRVRPDMADGCPEHFNLEFLFYTALFQLTRRKRTIARIAAFNGTVITLRSSADVRRFLATFARGS